jgi:hypothetical protein
LSDNKKSTESKFLYHKSLEDYLKKKLAIERDIKMKEETKTLITKTDRKVVRNNDDMKVRTLNNHVFRSMANLIYFFEFINKHHELDGVFDKDIEELFGLKGPHVKRHNVNDGNYLVFLRFLDAILNYDNTLIVEESEGKTLTKRRIKKKEFDTGRNIRLQLLKAISDAALEYIQNIAGEKEGQTPSLARLKIGKIIAQDLERTRIWTDYYCTSDVVLNTHEPHRKIAFTN